MVGIEANWDRVSCLKEKDWTHLQLIVDWQECEWVQCGELIHFFKKTWKSRLHVKSPNFYMAGTKNILKVHCDDLHRFQALETVP